MVSSRKCSGCGIDFFSAHAVRCLSCMVLHIETSKTEEVAAEKAALQRRAAEAAKIYESKRKKAAESEKIRQAKEKTNASRLPDKNSKPKYPGGSLNKAAVAVSEPTIYKVTYKTIGNTCVLCGANIAPFQMLKHKQDLHGETAITPSPAKPIKTGQWVSVYSGGLPSLGKRSR